MNDNPRLRDIVTLLLLALLVRLIEWRDPTAAYGWWLDADGRYREVDR